MGTSCILSKTTKRKENSGVKNCFEPFVYNMRMQQILNEYDIEQLKNKWDPEQVKIVASRLKLSIIQQSSFYELFPNFKAKKQPYSKKTMSNLFKMFVNKVKCNFLKKQEFLDKLTVLLNVQDFQVISDLLFFTYLYDEVFQRKNQQKRKQRMQQKKENKKIQTEENIHMQAQNSNHHIFSQISNPTPFQAEKEVLIQPNFYKTQLTQKDLQLFIEQNQQFLHQPIDKQTLKEQITNQRIRIGKKEFTYILSYYYDLQKMKQLFLFNLQGLQSEFICQLVQNKSICYKEKQKICVISRPWLDQWIKYVNMKFGVKISYQNKSFEIERILNWKKQEFSIQQIRKPPPINNETLQDLETTGLRRDIAEGHQYYIIPQHHFYKLKTLYSGGPTFKRIYPYIHTFQIIKASVNQRSQFYPNFRQIFNQTDLQKPITTLFNKKDIEEMDITEYVCYFRHPGEVAWSFVKDLHKTIASFFYSKPNIQNFMRSNFIGNKDSVNYNRTYICFVKKECQFSFENNYNPIKNADGSITIKNAIQNYGAILKITHDGSIKNCQITNIIKQDGIIKVAVQLCDDYGNSIRFCKSIQSLKNDNTEVQIINSLNLQKNKVQRNQISGLVNLGNSCYINSVIQCLVRTPYFDEYIKKFEQKYSQYERIKKFEPKMDFRSDKNCQNQQYKTSSFQNRQQDLQKSLSRLKSKNQLLFYGLFELYQQIQKQAPIIDTKKFKQCIDFHFPHFQGFQQQDAQQFLNQLLNKISEQLKQSKKQYSALNSTDSNKISAGESTQNKNQRDNLQPINKKIMKFFSGKIEIQTQCLKCNNRNSRTQNFFSYSLALPQHRQRQIFITVILKKDKVPIKLGFTVDKHTKIYELLRDLSKIINIPTQKLIFVTLFNGQWMQIYDGNLLYHEATELSNTNFGCICYEVQHINQISYQDLRFSYEDKFKGKSLKIQVRQRFFDLKNKRFQNYLIPFLVQVKQDTYWKEVQQYIKQKISIWNQQQQNSKKSIGLQNKGDFDTMSQKQAFSNAKIVNESNIINAHHNQKRKTANINKSQIHANLKQYEFQKNPKSPQQQEKRQQIKTQILRFKIRPIAKYANFDDKCLFCRHPFITKTFNNQQEKRQIQQKDKTQQKNGILNIFKSLSNNDKGHRHFCKEDPEKCSFSQQRPLFSQFQFRSKYDTLFIAVDWDQSYAVRNPTFTIDDSFSQAKNRQKNRKDKLTEIIATNIKAQERLQLDCENPLCKGKDGLRIQRIHTLPNILILHLKRFRYEGGSIEKLNNNIIFEDNLQIKGVQYDLYGIVCHTGSGLSGHYYSYILHAKNWYKCNDQLVQAIKQQRQIFDLNIYILFYKKRDFDSSLVCLKF